MYKVLFVLLFVLGFTIFLAVPSHAAENSLNINVQSTSDSITLTWDNIATSYEVYFEGQLVYQGPDAFFEMENLEPEYLTEFQINALNADGSLLDMVTVNASTVSDSQYTISSLLTQSAVQASALQTETEDNIETLESSEIYSVVNDTEISLDWSDIPGVSSYEVFRNEIKIADVDSSEFQDLNIVTNTDYQYELVGKKRFSDEAITEINQKVSEYELTSDFSLTTEEKEEFYNYNFSFIKDVKALNLTGTTMSISSASLSSSVDYRLRYTTFIPSIREPNPFDPFNSYIEGDNRGYDAKGSTYRTRADLNIHFGKTDKTSTAKLKKYVKPSKRFDIRTDKLIKSYKADPSGMKLSNKKVTKSSISFRLDHDIGTGYHPNLTPDITYYFKVKINRNGKYSIKGSRDKAPSHELYIRKNNGKYNKIFNAKNKGLRYLMPTYKMAGINYSN